MNVIPTDSAVSVSTLYCQPRPSFSFLPEHCLQWVVSFSVHKITSGMWKTCDLLCSASHSPPGMAKDPLLLRGCTEAHSCRRVEASLAPSHPWSGRISPCHYCFPPPVFNPAKTLVNFVALSKKSTFGFVDFLYCSSILYSVYLHSNLCCFSACAGFVFNLLFFSSSLMCTLSH